jgi:hypothetical protein
MDSMKGVGAGVGISTVQAVSQVTVVWAMARPMIFPFLPIVMADLASRNRHDGEVLAGTEVDQRVETAATFAAKSTKKGDGIRSARLLEAEEMTVSVLTCGTRAVLGAAIVAYVGG